ncbi:3-oxoacyl-ACP reductase [Leptospira ryugenii]|uniref:3-oxoacyl-ACP reductase n=1 Tax=Leptospira ryugenii TaxID=1917863 RepID=A0A2P2E445_9LEPT|nr:SDR family oxidoreductase [Leptospira ryugenii]GBF51655.1 3-oxoacyl-ACP reductase [Leptospira ryugenii]
MEKKVILITGTSRGIGESIYAHLDGLGHIVYGSSRTKPNQEIKRHIILDVTNQKECEQAVHSVIETSGKIDVLINNAGYHLTGASIENSLQELTDQINLNFYGSVYTSRAVIPHFLKRGQGRIINMSSLGGLLSLPFTSAYNASKFALEGYMESLRLELLPYNIYISNVEPGYVNSGTIGLSIGRPKESHSAFSRYREQMHKIMESESSRGTSKETIAKTIASIIDSKKPKLRYKLGNMSLFLPLMKECMPQNFFEKTVLKSFQLPIEVKA